MGKKVLYVFSLIIGATLLLMFIAMIPSIISTISSGEESSYKIGYVFGALLFAVPGFLLVRWSYRKLNPKESKNKDSIESIGER